MLNNKFLYNLLLTLGFLFFILSFISTINYPPWHQFIANFSIYLSIICFLFSILFQNKEIRINYWSYLFLIISIIPIIQYLFGYIYFLSTAFLSFSYLFIFFIVSVIFSNLFKQNEKFILRIVVLVILFITWFNIFVSYIQWLNIDLNNFFFLENKKNRVFGNLGQPNNFASLLLISFVVLIYWFESKKIKILLFYFNSFNIIFCLALTQSRAGILGFLAIMLFLILFRTRFYFINLKIVSITTIYFILINLYIIKLQNVITNWMGIDFLGDKSLVERAVNENTRFEIWSFFLKAIFEKPWFGYGWYQTQASQYYNFTNLEGRFVSAHNIFLDIFIWNGIIIGSIIIFALVFLLIFILMKINDNKDYLIFLVFFILLNHSLFEFPLFYPYFIFIFSIFLGYFFNKIDFKYLNINKFICAFFILIQAIFMYILWCDYIEYQDKKIYASNSGMGFKEPYSVNIRILDVLEKDLVLLSINKFDNLNEQEIYEIEKLISNNMSFYNLLKFCQILQNNMMDEKLEQTIYKLKILYNYNVDKKQLMSLQF